MRRQLSLLEFGHPDFWRHVEVFYGAAQSAAELLGILGHRQRLGTGQVVDLADMWFRVGQHNSGRSPDVGAGDRRGLAVGEWQADDAVVADFLGPLHQEHSNEEHRWTQVNEQQAGPTYHL